VGACEIDSALWDALLVAIKAFDGVNVMFAGLVVEGGIHLLNIESAVEMLGVATVAGSASLLAMLLMAGKAAQAFVDADRGAIVARIYFPRSDGRVALITERLPLVATHRNGTRMIEHCGFDWMKRNAAKAAPLGGIFWDGGAETFINKGINGRWRDTLGTEDIRAYEARALAELGPDCARWLANGNRI